MTEYVVLLPGNEDTWATTPDEEKQRVYGKHRAFQAALARRGHQITGGAELHHSREAKVVRFDSTGRLQVTDGPYAESAEQLTGFYVVDTGDVEDLMRCVGLLTEGESGGVEVRECVPMADPSAGTPTAPESAEAAEAGVGA